VGVDGAAVVGTVGADVAGVVVIVSADLGRNSRYILICLK
jgi:hypothetical protein